MNKDILKTTVQYYEESQDTMRKQAEELYSLRNKWSQVMNKFASYIDRCVKGGEIPEHLSDAMKISINMNPCKFVDFVEKKASFVDKPKVQPMGKPSEIRVQKADALSAWINS